MSQVSDGASVSGDAPAFIRRLEGACSYPDLGATVFPFHVPLDLGDELPGLYGSVFSTTDWFVIEDRRVPTGAVVLERPRHVLLFYEKRGTVEVLNKVFEVGPAEVERACRALFRALPGAHRIHLEVLFPPEQLALPKREIARTDHMMIDLPPDREEYDRSLTKRGQRIVRVYGKRLQEAFPDLTDGLMPFDDSTEHLFDRFVEWKVARFKAKGLTTYWETEAGLIERSKELLRRRGEVHVTNVAGEAAALVFLLEAGNGYCGYAGSFDPQYEPFRLGFLSWYKTVRSAVERGGRRYNAMWGTEGYKRDLGARPVRATQVSVFRSHPARLLSVHEAANIHYRRRKDHYWRARRGTGRLVKATLQRTKWGGSPFPGEDDEE